MSFSIKNTEFSGSAIVNNTSPQQKATFVQKASPSAGLITPTTVGNDVLLTDQMLLQAKRALWVDPIGMTGTTAFLSVPSVADTAVEAKRYQDLFGLASVNDCVSLTFPYTRTCPFDTELDFTLSSGASINHLRTQTYGGAYGNTATLAVGRATAQGSFATIQVRADNVTPGSEIISFNIAKQGTV